MRNAVCKCGSNKKFKKCCLLKQWDREAEKIRLDNKRLEELRNRKPDFTPMSKATAMALAIIANISRW